MLFKLAATSQVWLISSQYVANVTEEVHFYYYLSVIKFK